MDLFQSLILGIIQGVTEFLPISSTAHLALAPWILSWKDPGLTHNVALHFGSLTAIIYYFWEDWKLIMKHMFNAIIKRNIGKSSSLMLGLFLCIGTIPALVSGLLFGHQAATILRNPLIIALSLFAFSILLIWADRYSSNNKSMHQLTLKDCLIIGLAQAFAIIPGASRSGVCITGALFRNITRQDAAKYSFMLGAPLIFGATVYESRNIDPASVMDLSFISGIITSAIFAFLAIKYLIKFVSISSYKYFAYYRILLALIIVALELIL